MRILNCKCLCVLTTLIEHSGENIKLLTISDSYIWEYDIPSSLSHWSSFETSQQVIKCDMQEIKSRPQSRLARVTQLLWLICANSTYVHVMCHPNCSLPSSIAQTQLPY